MRVPTYCKRYSSFAVATTINPAYDDIVEKQRRTPNYWVNPSLDADEEMFVYENDSWLCVLCVEYVPEDAYHCGACQKCIDKHHHHCHFINNCVGRKNMRYFKGIVFTGPLLIFGQLASNIACLVMMDGVSVVFFAVAVGLAVNLCAVAMTALVLRVLIKFAWQMGDIRAPCKLAARKVESRDVNELNEIVIVKDEAPKERQPETATDKTDTQTGLMDMDTENDLEIVIGVNPANRELVGDTSKPSNAFTPDYSHLFTPSRVTDNGNDIDTNDSSKPEDCTKIDACENQATDVKNVPNIETSDVKNVPNIKTAEAHKPDYSFLINHKGVDDTKSNISEEIGTKPPDNHDIEGGKNAEVETVANLQIYKPDYSFLFDFKRVVDVKNDLSEKNELQDDTSNAKDLELLAVDMNDDMNDDKAAPQTFKLTLDSKPVNGDNVGASAYENIEFKLKGSMTESCDNEEMPPIA